MSCGLLVRPLLDHVLLLRLLVVRQASGKVCDLAQRLEHDLALDHVRRLIEVHIQLTQAALDDAENIAVGHPKVEIAAVIGALKPSARSPFNAVLLPELIRNNPNITWPGQDGGFMGHTWNPMVFKCNPAQPGFEIDGLKLPEGLSSLRVSDRASLLRQ